MNNLTYLLSNKNYILLIHPLNIEKNKKSKVNILMI